SKLGKQGLAADYAIVKLLLGGGDDAPDFTEARDTESTLYGILATHGSPVAVVGLLGRLHRNAGATEPDPWATYVLDALAQITGHDAYTYLPTYYLNEDIAWHKAAAEAWLGWWEKNQGRTQAEWRADGLAAARATLAAADSARDAKYLAARRLLEADGDKAQARVAIMRLVEDPELPADALWTYTSLASKAGAPQAEVADALKVRRKALIARGDENAKEEEVAEQRRERSVTLTNACQEAFYDLRLDESRTACEEAMTLDENNFAARLGFGWALLELGETEKARGVALDAVDLSWNEGVDDATDKAIHLHAAALTVNGDHDTARDTIRERLTAASRSNELRARLALLEGRPAPRTWVTYVAPRYFCWKAKGDADANAYLLRRGFVKPESFTTGYAALSEKRRTRLEKSGQDHCPWKEVVSEVK
ncbi:MAG: hypothetical protein IV100_28115, partial [Myxococcales bacterium]|nr:hypothetical protein [Myxococcales bacterium]